MGRARRDQRDQQRKSRARKRSLHDKDDGEVNVGASSFPVQQRQRGSTSSHPEVSETAPNGGGGGSTKSSAEAIRAAGDSSIVLAKGHHTHDIPTKENKKQTTTPLSPSMATTNPEKKIVTKQEQQRLKIRQRKEQRKAKKAASALAAIRVEEEQKRVTEALAQMQSSQKQEKQQLLRNTNFVRCSKGVHYCDIRIGKSSLLKQGEDVSVQYVLRAKNTQGKILESNDRFVFQLGKGNVIDGWVIGMEGIRRGGIRHVKVPKDAGYGDKDIGAGSGADLYFEIEVHL
jgi:FKBP-type peptidyl-prolyl cis-trans isomerase